MSNAAAAFIDDYETEANEQLDEANTPESAAEHLFELARAYKNLAKKIEGREDRIDEAEADIVAARKEIAASTEDPDAMNEAIKRMRLAEARVSRLNGGDTKAVDKARDALYALDAEIRHHVASYE